ncbi:hypothetical protein KY361_04075 [Candidatus Woesearchaeota archaeon]|nr:hypothetical protein [Candidatus Woesearchaeota archaeon]
METKKLLMILAIMILIGFTTAFCAYTFYNYHEVRELDMVLEVAPKLGFNTETGKLNFGANFPGNSCRRFVDISFPKKTKVVIGFKGQLADWVSVDDNGFILNANESKHLAFTANIPQDVGEGNYTGKARFYFKRI